MPLSQFPTAMPAAVTATLAAAIALRHIRDTKGDLTFRALDTVQDALFRSKVTTYSALVEGAKAPAAAEAFMAGVGGPASLADYQAAVVNIETKASAWNGTLSAALAELTGPELIDLVSRDVDGVKTRHIEMASFISAAKAGPLRASSELAALITAFEDVGA